MKFRKKPVVIDAIQYWPSLTCEELYEAFGIAYRLGEEPKPSPFKFPGGHIEIHTLEGVMRADPHDWIIRGIKGEFYPCKPDIFAATYEPVEASTPATAGGDEEEPKPDPNPVGRCSKCGTNVYSTEGFCGVCEPWKR